MGQENNQTSTTRLQTSLQTEYQAAVRKFGEGYVSFLKKYPTLRNRDRLITTAYDAVRNGGMSLVQIDNYFGDGASEWWIKVMLVDLLTFLGAMETISPFQVKGIAARIRQNYYSLTPAELTYFFYTFSMGDYGKLYSGSKINPQDILTGLRICSNELSEQRTRIERTMQMDKLHKDRDSDRVSCVSFDKWKEIRGLGDDSENPLLKISKITNKVN